MANVVAKCPILVTLSLETVIWKTCTRMMWIYKLYIWLEIRAILWPKCFFLFNSFTFPSSVFMTFSPNFLFVTCWWTLVQFSVCNMLMNVSPSFPCVTCYTRRIGTDGLTITHTDTHVTLYNRITKKFSSVVF